MNIIRMNFFYLFKENKNCEIITFAKFVSKLTKL